jgi:hypothetical protein
LRQICRDVALAGHPSNASLILPSQAGYSKVASAPVAGLQSACVPRILNPQAPTKTNLSSQNREFAEGFARGDSGFVAYLPSAPWKTSWLISSRPARIQDWEEFDDF